MLAQIQSLNPLTRDLFIRSQYAVAKGDYTTRLQTLMMGDPGLTLEAKPRIPRLTQTTSRGSQSSSYRVRPCGIASRSDWGQQW